MGSKDKPIATTWRSTQGDLTDEEWDLIADLIPTYSGDGRMGRPTKWDKRDIVNAIFYVAATGCQWRALPPNYPHWNTVHRYHVRWSEKGIWEQVCRDSRTRSEHVKGVRRNRRPGPSMPEVSEVPRRLPAPPGDMTPERRCPEGRPSGWSTPSVSSSP